MLTLYMSHGGILSLNKIDNAEKVDLYFKGFGSFVEDRYAEKQSYSVIVEGRGFLKSYYPDPKDGRIIQYQDGSNNIMSGRSSALVSVDGISFSSSLWGEDIPGGIYEGYIVLSGGWSGGNRPAALYCR